MKKAVFSTCEISDTDFQSAGLSEADFTGTRFREARFHNTNLEKADFIQAEGYQVDPRNNQIKKAQFSLPEALSLLDYFEIELVN